MTSTTCSWCSTSVCVWCVCVIRGRLEVSSTLESPKSRQVRRQSRPSYRPSKLWSRPSTRRYGRAATLVICQPPLHTIWEHGGAVSTRRTVEPLARSGGTFLDQDQDTATATANSSSSSSAWLNIIGSSSGLRTFKTIFSQRTFQMPQHTYIHIYIYMYMLGRICS